MRAVLVSRRGGPDVLEVTDVPDPVAEPGGLLVRVAAAGVNYKDVYEREGAYPVPVPFVLGSEGSGTVEAVGAGVDGFAAGDRVAWAAAPGSTAELAVVPAAVALRVPDGVALDVAAALPLQGLTAHYLATSTHAVAPGDVAVVHAAAGGVGLLLTQVVTARGGRVIATCSTDAKAELARAAGADAVVRYDREDVAGRVRELTGGRGADVVYDGVGRATFEGSLAALRPRGLLALYGAASGPVPPFDLQRLNRLGSLFVTRPTLGDHVADRAELLGRAEDLFGWLLDGSLDVRIGGRYALADAAGAHRDLEARSTTGKLLVLP